MTRSASHVSRALAAWREVNPQGLIGRLIELHRRDPQQALVLARYAEPHGYEGLAEDVAAWPVVHGPATVRARYLTLCPVCDGWGWVEPRDIGESLAEALQTYPELTAEELLEAIQCPMCEGAGEVPVQPVCPSCSGSGRWGDDVACEWCNGEGVLR